MSFQENTAKPGFPTGLGPSGRWADMRDVREMLYGLAEAWNHGDGEAYGAHFTDQSDYIAFDGTHLRGREANVRHHQALFDSVLRGSRLVFEGEPAIRFVAPDVAIVHAMGSVLLPWQTRVTAKRRSNQTLIAVRTERGWRFTAFHNTRYRPFRLPDGVVLSLIVAFMRLRTACAAALGIRVAARQPEGRDHGA